MTSKGLYVRADVRLTECMTLKGVLTVCLCVIQKWQQPQSRLTPMENQNNLRRKKKWLWIKQIFDPVYIYVFTLYVSCEEDMQSLSVCSSRVQTILLMLCWSFLLPFKSGDRCVFKQQPKGHLTENLLSSVKMWRVIMRTMSTILWLDCKQDVMGAAVVLYSTLLCLLQDLWQVETSSAAPFLLGTHRPYSRNQLVNKEMHRYLSGRNKRREVLKFDILRKNWTKTLHQT